VYTSPYQTSTPAYGEGDSDQKGSYPPRGEACSSQSEAYRSGGLEGRCGWAESLFLDLEDVLLLLVYSENVDV